MGGDVAKNEVDEALKTIRARLGRDAEALQVRVSLKEIEERIEERKKQNKPIYLTPQPSRAQLPGESTERKRIPIATGVLFYFPDAIAEVARVSYEGNEQHNPGQPLHWAREKSTDHADCIGRHLLQVGTRDTDNMRHAAKLAWRALALLQLEVERDRALAQAWNSPNATSAAQQIERERQVKDLFVATDAHDAAIVNTVRAGMKL
jgi:hypothetical protein